VPALAVGIVGAGRTRNGLGPFLAAFAERAGARVTGVAGRDAAGAERNAAALAVQLGHPVAAFADAAALARSGVQALVVATPPAEHLPGLRAALAAGIACLCEKPLVAVEQLPAGAAALAAFAARRLLLLENCQWPHVLPALRQLFPLPPLPVRAVAMGLSPTPYGRAGIEDSLPHLLSVVQALVPAPEQLQLADVQLVERSGDGSRQRLALSFRAGGQPVAVTLHLQQTAHQPRPAWLEVDGCRMDRRIGPDYALAFAAGDRVVQVGDPLGLLVYDFVNLARSKDLDAHRRLTAVIACRLRLYGEILARCP